MVAMHENKIREITYKTFEITCYMFPLDEWEIEEQGKIELGEDSISALVGFDGAAKGAMIIRVSPVLLDAIAENMLGLDKADTKQKQGALCEIANIICGNTVPVFAKDEKICYIHPPRIITDFHNPGEEFEQMQKEHLQVFLDEGVVELTIFYTHE